MRTLPAERRKSHRLRNFAKPRSMTKFLLHIGTHKTGTTTRQKFMSSVAGELYSSGVLYPERGCPRPPNPHNGHHLLPFSIRKHKLMGATESVWTELLDEVAAKAPRLVVLSSEEFSLCPPAHIARIRDYLSEFAVEVIVYLRNHFRFMFSVYCQLVKNGTTQSPFREFLAVESHRCDYGRLVSDWSDVFGREAVSIRVYDKIARDHRLIEDFLAHLEFDPQRFRGRISKFGRYNRTPSDQSLRMLKLLNRLEGHLPSQAPVKRGIHILRRVIRSVDLPSGFHGRSSARSSQKRIEAGDADVLRQIISRRHQEFLENWIASENRAFLNFKRFRISMAIRKGTSAQISAPRR